MEKYPKRKGRDERDGGSGAQGGKAATAAAAASAAKAPDPKVTDDGGVVPAETGLVTPGCEPLVLSTRGSTWSVSTRRLQRGHKTTCPRGQAEETSSGSGRRTRPGLPPRGRGGAVRASTKGAQRQERELRAKGRFCKAYPSLPQHVETNDVILEACIILYHRG